MAMTWREAIQFQDANTDFSQDVPRTVTVNRAELRELIDAAKAVTTGYGYASITPLCKALSKALKPFEGDK